MRKLLNVVTVILATQFGGCLQFVADQPTFEKRGSTQSEFNRDTYECDRDTVQARIENIHSRQNFFNRCMIARGWEITHIKKGY
jgi:hypothetical protein